MRSWRNGYRPTGPAGARRRGGLLSAAWCALLATIPLASGAQTAAGPADCVGPSALVAETERWLNGLDAAAEGAAPHAAEDGCLRCHADAGRLIGMIDPPDPPAAGGCATAPSRPPFLGYFVNPGFPASLHGMLGCTGCHGGDATATSREDAHAGLQDPTVTCASCHGEIVARHETSLHHTLNGMAHALRLRSGGEMSAPLATVWQADCATCHTTCGDCHVALPDAVGGGLIKGHEFLRRAPMRDSCALCHGTRAGGEYLGRFDGLAPDVHFEAGMHCLDCHTNDLHGDGRLYQSRWQVAGRAQCSDCHAVTADSDIPAHGDMHRDVSCQVCHGQPYQNCFDCHTGEEDGAYFRRAGAAEMMLRIGRATPQDHPHGITTLRHNPVARDSFDHFGTGLMPVFDDVPNWKTAAPHNIRRRTPQNRSCAACHEDDSLFLGAEDLSPRGPAANRDVILPWP